MAIGDDAVAAGYPLVPKSGERGMVNQGPDEINYTRDLIAQLKNAAPATKSASRTLAGISSGTANPDNASGEDGDIYFKIIG